MTSAGVGNESEINPETLDLLLEHAKDTPQRQTETALSYDSKTIQVFAAASIVIGLVATSGLDMPLGLVVAALVAYGIVAATTIYELWVRQLRVCDSPAILWSTFWSDQPLDVKHALITDLADGDTENERTLRRKRAALLFLLAATFVEVVLVGAAISAALE